MKYSFSKGLGKLSLTQQVMVLIFLMLCFLTVFFIFFLSDSITDTISQQIFDMIQARQQPVITALDMGKSAAFDEELFDYLASDAHMTTGIVSNDFLNILSVNTQGKGDAEFLEWIEGQAQAMLDSPEDSFAQARVTYDGAARYYRMEKTDYKGTSSVVFSFMDDTYANSIRTTLMDSTVYITVLAFFLILMIFVFWVFSIIHPLNQIRSYIAQIKEGKDVDLYINREDEIGEVANELRTLTTELAKQQKAKEDMIHNISHDLKTPIATIKSYSESIKDGIYPYGDLESSVDVILDNAKRLEDKVHSLLYMNRVEYLITSDAQGVVTNMKDVVEQVVLNSAVIRPEIEIKTDVQEVFFDGLMESWRVCIENIMENAFRYAKTYIRIEVRENELRISNDGPKMPPDRIDSLFQPYIKGEGGRFGLGLSIVWKVVQANKYKVQGLNTDDGVCFRIYRDVPASNKGRQSVFGMNKNGMSTSHWNSSRRNDGKNEKSEKTEKSAKESGSGASKENSSSKDKES